MGEDITEVFRSLGLSNDVRVCVISSPDNSALAIGEALHKAIDERLRTTPHTAIIDSSDESPEEFEEVLNKLAEECKQKSTLIIKDFDHLTPVDSYTPKEIKKRPSFRDKKYF